MEVSVQKVNGVEYPIVSLGKYEKNIVGSGLWDVHGHDTPLGFREQWVYEGFNTEEEANAFGKKIAKKHFAHGSYITVWRHTE